MLTDIKLQQKTSAWLLNVILDSGGTDNMIYLKVLPKSFVPEVLSKPIKYQVIMIILNYHHPVVLEKLILPKYNKSKFIDEKMDYVLDGGSKYNII